MTTPPPSSVKGLRLMHIDGSAVVELGALPQTRPARGFLWLSVPRSLWQAETERMQALLSQWVGQTVVDLHVSDLLNPQLPSHYDYTAQYDLMVFRRLSKRAETPPGSSSAGASTTEGSVLRRIDTDALGFVVFDALLFSVHPDDCAVRNSYADRLLHPPLTGNAPSAPVILTASGSTAAEGTNTPGNNSVSSKGVPQSPADLMLRIISSVIDAYLDLRRELSRQLDLWQAELLRPRSRFADWPALLRARLSLHQLDDICEDQQRALRDWMEALQVDSSQALRLAQTQGPLAAEADGLHGLTLADVELLKLRGRDVVEHIERVAHHVRRLEQATETAVQLHFNVQGSRTNDIMRTLTTLTAIFLPLNLIAAIFGMNFEFIPWVHQERGFWWALGIMVLIAGCLALFFWRKRYLARDLRR